MDKNQDSIFEATKMHWRSFVFAWLSPIVLIFAFDSSHALGIKSKYIFWVLCVPLFFWGYISGGKPLERGEISGLHHRILSMLVPLLIFIVVGGISGIFSYITYRK